MKKIRPIGVAMGIAALGILLPTASAQAQAPAQESVGVTANQCATVLADPAHRGYVLAYDGTYCAYSGYLGRASGDDSYWGNDQGGFKGRADDKASSVVNAGVANGWGIVAFYSQSVGDGGELCLGPGDYIDTLATDRAGKLQKFSNGAPADNNITSHYWVRHCSSQNFGY
ncbi:hypothetical protein [Streptomyces niveus]|uniref:hypothetical protein n=1 Tax=Streptomyces niveus TaxID=193462 RepID=UPI00366715BB